MDSVIHYAYDVWSTASRSASVMGVMGYNLDENFKRQKGLLRLKVRQSRL